MIGVLSTADYSCKNSPPFNLIESPGNNFQIEYGFSFEFSAIYVRVTEYKDWILKHTEGAQDSNCRCDTTSETET